MHMIPKQIQWLMSVILLMPLLAACAAAPPVPEENFYRLQADYTGTALARNVLNGTLEVEPLSGEGLVARRYIVYSQAGTPNQLKTYNYHLWNEVPAVMLGSELISYLRAANVAERVVTPKLRVRADYVLSGRIKRLERILGASNRTLISLELAVRSATGGKLLFLKEYKLENDASGNDLVAAVDSLNTSLSVIYADFVDDLSKM